MTAPKCGARKKQGSGRCTQIAGWGTDHPRVGKCKLHGGATPVKSGRYSKIKRTALRELIAQHAEDQDPLDILPELAAARALFQDFIERYDEWREALLGWHESFTDEEKAERAKPRQILDIADAYRILSEVTKIAERIEKIRSQNAVSRSDLLRIMEEMGRYVERHVKDSKARERIKDGWLSIRIA